MTGEITREYLNRIGFRPDKAKIYDVNAAFGWYYTHEGFDYWFLQEGDGLTAEGKAKIDEMIRVWEGKEPNQETAIEYCITGGEGRLVDYGVTAELHAEVSYVLHHDEDWGIIGVAYAQYHAVPTTTACQTGA